MDEAMQQGVHVVVESSRNIIYDIGIPLFSVIIGGIIASYFTYLYSKKTVNMRLELELIESAYKTIYQLRETASQLLTYTVRADSNKLPDDFKEKCNDLAVNFSEGIFRFKEIFYADYNNKYFNLIEEHFNDEFINDLMMIEAQSSINKIDDEFENRCIRTRQNMDLMMEVINNKKADVYKRYGLK